VDAVLKASIPVKPLVDNESFITFFHSNIYLSMRVYSGNCKTDSGISKGTAIQLRRFLDAGNYGKGTPIYPEINKVVEVQEGNLQDRSFDDSETPSSLNRRFRIYTSFLKHICWIPLQF